MKASRRQINALDHRAEPTRSTPAERERLLELKLLDANAEVADYRRKALVETDTKTGASERQVRIIRRVPVEEPDEE